MKETIEQVFERCTSTDFSSLDRSEIFKAMQEYADMQNAELIEFIKEVSDWDKDYSSAMIRIKAGQFFKKFKHYCNLKVKAS